MNSHPVTITLPDYAARAVVAALRAATETSDRSTSVLTVVMATDDIERAIEQETAARKNAAKAVARLIPRGISVADFPLS